MANRTLSGDCILTVTRGGVLYRDDQERVCWLALPPCRDTWLATRPNATALDQRMVGARSRDRATPVLVRLFGPEAITFMFASESRRQRQLIAPLSHVGWYTVIEA